MIVDFILWVVIVFVVIFVVSLIIVLGGIESFWTAVFRFEVVQVMAFHSWRLDFLEQDSILSLDLGISLFLLEIFFLN